MTLKFKQIRYQNISYMAHVFSNESTVIERLHHSLRPLELDLILWHCLNQNSYMIHSMPMYVTTFSKI